ncbi:unnamed protein product [Acidithrix sp. C25]|nr:unnamed protein product [Acidithrix sp. C25]
MSNQWFGYFFWTGRNDDFMLSYPLDYLFAEIPMIEVQLQIWFKTSIDDIYLWF